MGTSGLFGFFYKGKYYVSYNHNDSYPSYLGSNIVNEVIQANIDEWIQLLEKIKVIAPGEKPTPEDIEKLAKYTDLGVSDGTTQDWYCLLRQTQGSLNSVLQSGYLQNCFKSNGEPEHMNYSYIVNLDSHTFEYYAFGKKEKEVPLEKDDLDTLVKEWNVY